MNRYETEDEQVAAIKSWWKKNGTQLLTAILVVAVAFSGWRYWSSYNQAKAANASAVYELLQANMQQGSFGEVSREGLKLMQEQPQSPYAAGAALLLAKFHIEKGEMDEAKQQLQWVIAHSDDAALKQTANLRLARLQADQKAFDDAKQTLQAIKPDALMTVERGNYDYVSGLIALAQNDLTAARDAFSKVVGNAGASKTLQGVAQIQLDDLAQ